MGSLTATKALWSGSLWPSGHFGVGRVREVSSILPEAPRGGLHPSVFRNVAAFRAAIEKRDRKSGDAGNRVELDKLALHSDRGFNESCLSMLNLTERKSERSKRGLGGLSAHGRKTVESGAVLLEQRYGAKNLAFWTCTLPPMSVSSFSRLVDRWGEVQRRLHQEIIRRQQRMGLPGSVVGVTEIQPQRFEATGVPWLHIHWCFPARLPGGPFIADKAWYLSLWRRTLADFVPELRGVKFLPGVASRVEVVRSSAAGYLAKYLGKGGDSVELARAIAPDMLPSSWYTISNNLRRAVKRSVIKVIGEIAKRFLDFLESGNAAILSSYSVAVERTYGQLKVGQAGKLSREVAGFLIREDRMMESLC